jgi:hypothetical protein
MPLNNAYLPKVDGLQTETSPISADPRSLSDCVDIISDVEDSIEARHGHPSVYFQNVYGPFSSNQNPIDLYAYRNETEKVFVCLYKGTDNIYRYRQVLTPTEEIDENSNYEAISIIDNKSITRLSSVNSKPTAFAHDERLLFLTDYGVFYNSYSNYAQTPEKVDFPVIRTANVKSRWLPADTSFTDAEQENRHWLVPGFQVNVKIVIEIDAKQTEKGERVLLSPPSKIYEVKNFNLSNIDNSKRTSNTLVTITGVRLSHIPANSDYTVKFYRTPQFPIGESPITEYFYAGEEKQAQIQYSGNSLSTTSDRMVGITITPNGLTMYVADYDLASGHVDILKYNLSTAFDLSTATSGGTTDNKFTPQYDMCYKSNGTSLFRLAGTGSSLTVYEHAMSTDYDVTTANSSAISNKLIGNTVELSGIKQLPKGLTFSNDGKYFYVSGGLAGIYDPSGIAQFTMSTPWDITTATYTRFLELSEIDDTIISIRFDSTGEYLILLGRGTSNSQDALYILELDEPWNISKASYIYSTAISGTSPTCFFNSMVLSSNGDYLYICDDTSEKVYQYNVNDISGAVYLTANDDVVTTLEHLYNDTSQGGFSITNHLPIPAKNVTEFLNYYIYSCITPPTISQFGLKQLPKDGDTLTLRLSGAAGVTAKEKTITFKNIAGLTGFDEVEIAANATSLTSNYLSTEDDLTFTGLRSTQALDTVVRIVPGTGQGEVPAYGRITQYGSPGDAGAPPTTSAVLRVIPNTEGFDINKFPQPGVAAVVSSTGKVRLLFSYASYRRVSASGGFIDFEGCVSVGGYMPQGITYVGDYYMYALNVENLETQLVTSAGVNTTTSNLSLYYGDGSNYLSLLPCKNSLPFPVASPSPITTTAGATALFDGSGSDFLVNPLYVGLLNKPQGKLLDDMAIAIADSFQNLMNDSNSAIISCTGGESRENGVVNVEILDPTYEIIEFRRGANSTDIYEPAIETTNTEFARSEDEKSAFVISKQNNPELIPYGGTSDIAGPYVTTKVGNPDKAIVACASTKDSVYFLKEDGIARLSLVPGALVPLVDSIFIFDNTTFCVSAGSVQNLQDSIVFLAQDGVYRLSGTSIQKLSIAIEREVKTAISECRSVNKQNDIRSFANDAKGLYGLTIPLTGANFVTYVLSTNTMRWTKWSNTWKGAVVDQDGRLTTHIGDATDNGLRQDKYTNGNPYNPVDQIDDNISLNGFSATDTGNVRSFDESNLGLACNRLGSKQVYYRQNDGTLTKVTVQVVDSNNVNITFPSAPPTFNNGDSLVAGVNVSLTFNPFTNNNSSDLKMFSGFHIHTLSNVKDLKCSFRTEARNTFSTVTSFSVSPTDRNVYRCNIPLEAVRGRYLYRKIDHVRPFEIFSMPAQAIVFRDTGSTRVNKENG